MQRFFSSGHLCGGPTVSTNCPHHSPVLSLRSVGLTSSTDSCCYCIQWCAPKVRNLPNALHPNLSSSASFSRLSIVASRRFQTTSRVDYKFCTPSLTRTRRRHSGSLFLAALQTCAVTSIFRADTLLNTLFCARLEPKRLRELWRNNYKRHFNLKYRSSLAHSSEHLSKASL